ncbi:diguanylate cyclase [Hoeflea alexandrii]|uniref:GGDEF domain-containing protein n=1 Tax=Hoeflea alexandrii TaxID=288436 RepID=UPI00226E7555|nr:diguanylate cyclase [Hoeflea alexandrii]MCY0154421.1 diguanylate cyclase [Hoeflea alexandrii]
MAWKAVRYGIGTNSLGFRLTAIYIALAGICLALATIPFLSEHSVSDVALHMNMAIAGLIGTAILMALMSRRLTGPIRKLTEVARKVAEGHLNVKVPVDCSCEIGELGASMRTMVARLQASTTEISELANHDLVTGLPNRNRLQTLLERQTGLVGADGAPASGSVFFIDVLELRKVNDRFGHETSDQLLKTIASLLVAASPCKSHGDNLRSSGSEDDALREPVLARFGGTELVLSVPDLTDPDGIASVARRLHAALARRCQGRRTAVPSFHRDRHSPIPAGFGLGHQGQTIRSTCLQQFDRAAGNRENRPVPKLDDRGDQVARNHGARSSHRHSRWPLRGLLPAQGQRS